MGKATSNRRSRQPSLQVHPPAPTSSSQFQLCAELVKCRQNLTHILGDDVQAPLLQWLRDGVQGLRHAAGNAGEGVAVSTQTYSGTDSSPVG